MEPEVLSRVQGSPPLDPALKQSNLATLSLTLFKINCN
jgi:hypothetical protein